MNQPGQTGQSDAPDSSAELLEEGNMPPMGDAANQPHPGSQQTINPVQANVGLIMDIPVTVSMELGRTRISIRELLSMNPGAVISLDRLATDPMEILVNGTLVAHGEAVKVGDRFGVRLTHVVSTADRLKQVNE